MKTTLNEIRSKHPCTEGWKMLLSNLGKTQGDDEPLALTTVLDSNGLDDALWCLQTVEGYDREIRLFCIRCARHVQHLMKDPRSVAALDVAECFANGKANSLKLGTTYKEAHSAFRDATGILAINVTDVAKYTVMPILWFLPISNLVDCAVRALTIEEAKRLNLDYDDMVGFVPTHAGPRKVHADTRILLANHFREMCAEIEARQVQPSTNVTEIQS